MVVFYSETHLPYATRYPYYRQFADPHYSGRHRLSVSVPSLENVANGGLDLDQTSDANQVRALYDGAILSFDDQVGVVLKALEKFHLRDDTIVIITTDHGEDLLESPSSWGHGRFFWGDDYDNRIPLIVSDPELRGRERVVRETMSSIDLMPTLLERVGLPAPATCEGHSVLDLWRGQRAERDRFIFAENCVLLGGEKELDTDRYLRYPPLMETLELTEPETGQVGLKREYMDLIIEAKHRMIRSSQWKLIYMPLVTGARYELYDLRSDPECRRDVKDKYPVVFEEFKKRLWDWMEKDPRHCRRGDHMVPREVM
jgi:arylsulfatase A-like enzyme